MHDSEEFLSPKEPHLPANPDDITHQICAVGQCLQTLMEKWERLAEFKDTLLVNFIIDTYHRPALMFLAKRDSLRPLDQEDIRRIITAFSVDTGRSDWVVWKSPAYPTFHITLASEKYSIEIHTSYRSMEESRQGLKQLLG